MTSPESPFARTARDHPEDLPFALEHVAEVEDAKRHLTEHPSARPPLPEDPREFLHLLAVEAWRALAGGWPAPSLDLAALEEGIDEALGKDSPIDWLCDDWLEEASEQGMVVYDADGEILPGVLGPVSRVITAAFWAGLTTGHYAITREVSTPRRFLPYFGSSAAGTWG